MASDPYWRVSGDAPLQSVLEWPQCPSVLHRALTGAISWQTRNETSVLRALRSSRVPAQWVAALLVLDARAVIDGAEGEDLVPLEDFLLRNASGKLVALDVPVTADPASAPMWGEARVSRTPADEPVVTAYAQLRTDGVTVRDARVALTGVWAEPARLASAAVGLIGSVLDDEIIESMALAVQDEIAPPSDYLGSTEYRRAMAGVLTRRALQQCRDRQGGTR